MISERSNEPGVADYLSYSDLDNKSKVDEFYSKFKSNGTYFNLSVEAIIANLKAIQLTRSALMDVTPFLYNQICYYGDPKEAAELFLEMESRKTAEETSIIGVGYISGYLMILLKANRYKELPNTVVPACS